MYIHIYTDTHTDMHTHIDTDTDTPHTQTARHQVKFPQQFNN